VNIRCTGDAKVFADPLLFQRAVANLLSNALRYTRRGSEIVLDVKSQPDGSASVTVANPGAGIPAEHLARLFDRMYRVEASREKTTEGAGLGLAIVKSIMELHHGDISVNSMPGGLTVFKLSFPPAAETLT
jgi:two-component system heavy metal sensor histidine kinase CusS